MEIDESGVDKLQKVLTQNRTLAEELASAFDSARIAVDEFFRHLSSSTLPTGELSPWQRLNVLSEKGFTFALNADTAKAEDTESDAPRLEDMPDVVRQAQADYERNQQSTES